MIDRVLDKTFVLACARTALRILESRAPELESELEIEQADEQLPAVAAELREAIDREGPEVESLSVEERKAYVPTDPVLATVQTALQDFLTTHDPELVQPSLERTGPGGPAATAVYLGLGDIVNDARMAYRVIKALAKRKLRGTHKFVESKPPPDFDIAMDARIVLVGDWGMGNASARKIATLIKADLDAVGGKEAHLIHLGDVYFTGETSEAQKHVLDLWPIKQGDANRFSWALNGNHDMYSGGYGYFDKILADPRFARQRTPDGRGTSYFMLRNKYWQFLGLDTACEVHGLGLDGYINDTQAKWVKECTDAPQDRRTVLMSHHQYLSRHNLGGDLLQKLKPVLDAGGFDAWFWGHEHICRRFAKTAKVRYPACVGNGAMPQAVNHVAQEQGGWEYDQGYGDDEGDEWRLCGYAVLDLANDKIEVRYKDEDGKEHHSPESLPV